MSIQYFYLENFHSWMVMGTANINGRPFSLKSHFKRSKLEATTELFTLIEQAIIYTKTVPTLAPAIII